MHEHVPEHACAHLSLLAPSGFWALLAPGRFWLLAPSGSWLLLAPGPFWLLDPSGSWPLLAPGPFWLLAHSIPYSTHLPTHPPILVEQGVELLRRNEPAPVVYVVLEGEAALGCSLLGLAEGRVSGLAWDVWMLKASPATPCFLMGFLPSVILIQ